MLLSFLKKTFHMRFVRAFGFSTSCFESRRFVSQCSIALIVCGIFLIVGIVVLDDYGLSNDDYYQRALAIHTINYVLGKSNALFERNWARTYGVAFELLTLLVERILGLEDSRHVHLSRHLLTHLFFLSGGFFCSLLVYRLFNSRLLALFALLLFLIHPRMYAHSFFNSKDLPFLSMFMIALFFLHRAFRKDTFSAFILCGMGIAILTNIRIGGVMLFAAVLAMRACDLFYASDQEERKHILRTTRGFALAGVLTLYVTWPYLWSNPVGHFIKSFSQMAHYPFYKSELFQGEMVHPMNLPPDYVLGWFSIMTPPVALLLGIIGTGSILFRGVIHPCDILRNTPLRFGFLLVGCFVLPVLAIVLLGSTLYDKSRQVYFLYAPFCLVAVFGLHWLVSLFKRTSLRAGIYVLAGMGVAMTLVAMIRIHPYQHDYFNFLVDRTTPEYNRRQYSMGTGSVKLKSLEFVREHYPSSPIYIADDGYYMGNTRKMLPKEDRQRVFIGIGLDAPNFSPWAVAPKGMEDIFVPSKIYTGKVYNNTIVTMAKLDLSPAAEALADAWREAYRLATDGKPVVSSKFDVYFNENDLTLTYIQESCQSDLLVEPFLLTVYPVSVNDLPDKFKHAGYGTYDFFFREHGVVFDGKCVATVKLPKYRIASIHTGQYINRLGWDYSIWKAEFPVTESGG